MAKYPAVGLASYSELAYVLDRLPLLLREARRSRRLPMRVAAQEVGLSPATLCRIEAGEDCELSSALALLRWLDGGGR
jgi:DNA-binding XRE family transcriptional regulator